MDRLSKLFILAAISVLSGFSATLTVEPGPDLAPNLIPGPIVDPVLDPVSTNSFNALADTTWPEIKAAWFSGKEVRLLRGVTYEVGANGRMIDPKCDPCYLGAYGEGANPILKTTTGETLFAIFSRPENVRGLIFEDIDLVGMEGTGGTGIWLYNGTSEVTLNNVNIDGFRVGFNIASNTAAVTDNISINGGNIINNSVQGILGSAKTFHIDNVTFDNNGYKAPVLGHNVYISGKSDVSVTNSRFSRSAIDANGNCTSVSLVVHGNVDGLDILNNTFVEPNTIQQCFMIAVGAGYNSPELFKNVKINDNVLKGGGNIGIYMDQVVTGEILRNEIIQPNDWYYTGIRVKALGRDGIPSTGITVADNNITIIYPDGGSTKDKAGLDIHSEGAIVERNSVIEINGPN